MHAHTCGRRPHTAVAAAVAAAVLLLTLALPCPTLAASSYARTLYYGTEAIELTTAINPATRKTSHSPSPLLTPLGVYVTDVKMAYLSPSVSPSNATSHGLAEPYVHTHVLLDPPVPSIHVADVSLDWNGDATPDPVVSTVSGLSVVPSVFDAPVFASANGLINVFSDASDATVVGLRDMDGNGVEDLVIVTNELTVQWISQGSSGTFDQSPTFLTSISGMKCSFGAVVDVNGDGMLDIVLLDDTSKVQMLIPTSGPAFSPFSTATFSLSTSAYSISNGQFIAVADIDADGDLDAVISWSSMYSFSSSIDIPTTYVLLNSAASPATPSYTPAPGCELCDTSSTRDNALADFDGDGVPELVTACPNLAVNYGTNMCSLSVQPTDMSLVPVAAVSFDLANTTGAAAPSLIVLTDDERIIVFDPAPSPTFLTATYETDASIVEEGKMLTLDVEDVNGDGFPDCIVSQGAPFFHNVILGDSAGPDMFPRGAARGRIAPNTYYPSNSRPVRVVPRADSPVPRVLVTGGIPGSSSTNLALLTTELEASNGLRFAADAHIPIATPSMSQYGSLVVADFDDDGLPDLVFVGRTSGAVLTAQIVRATSSAPTFDSPVTVTSFAGSVSPVANVTLAVGSLRTASSRPQLFVSDNYELRVFASPSPSPSLFSESATYTLSSEVATFIQVAHVDADGVPDLAFVTDSNITVMFGDGVSIDGLVPVPLVPAEYGDSFFFVDVNDDAWPDLIHITDQWNIGYATGPSPWAAANAYVFRAFGQYNNGRFVRGNAVGPNPPLFTAPSSVAASLPDLYAAVTYIDDEFYFDGAHGALTIPNQGYVGSLFRGSATRWSSSGENMLNFQLTMVGDYQMAGFVRLSSGDIDLILFDHPGSLAPSDESCFSSGCDPLTFDLNPMPDDEMRFVDVNLDGIGDMIYLPAVTSGNFHVALGSVNYPFFVDADVQTIALPPACTNPTSFAVFDLDDNGLADVIFACDAPVAYMYTLNANPVLPPVGAWVNLVAALPPSPPCTQINSLVFNRNPSGAQALVLCKTQEVLMRAEVMSSGPGTAALGTLAPIITSSYTIPVRSYAKSQKYPSFADVDGDGDMDVVVLSSVSPYLSVLHNTGTDAAPTYTRVSVLPDTFTSALSACAVHDFDGDGDVDLAVSLPGWPATIVFSEPGGGGSDPTFSVRPTVVPLEETHMSVIHVADVNRDGWRDLVTAKRFDRYIWVYAENSMSKTRNPEPETFEVDVASCGRTLHCIYQTAGMMLSSLDPDTALVPPGTYTGCRHFEPFAVAARARISGGSVTAPERPVLDCALGSKALGSGWLGFDVHTEDGDLTLHNLMLSGFVSPDTGSLTGGPLLSISTRARGVLDGVDVRLCQALEPDAPSALQPSLGYGGAVLVDGASFEVYNSLLENNRADVSGGAIAVIGTSSSVLINRTRITANSVTQAGGALFLEALGGVSAVDVVDSVFESNSALGDEARDDIVSRGGAMALSVLGGTADIALTGSTFATNWAKGIGGAVHVSVFAEAVPDVVLSATTMTGNSAGDSGGAAAVSVADGASLTVNVADGTRIAGNSAGGSGGGLHVTSTVSSYELGYVPSCLVTIGSGSTVSGNTARKAGGAVFAGAPRSPLPVPDPAVLTLAVQDAGMASNSAELGGAIASLGEVLVSVSASSFTDNTAAYGGSIATALNDGYLQPGTEGPGLTFDGSSAALPPALYDSESTSAGTCTAVRRGSVTVDDTAFSGTDATYGGALFSCENPITLTNLGEVSTRQRASSELASGGGLFFACRTSLDCVGDPGLCCSDGSAPWLTLDATTFATANASLGSGASVQYGPLYATPPASMQVVGTWPQSLSSGLAFGRSTPSLVLRDAFGQIVRDGRVSAELVITSDVSAAVFTGTEPTVSLASDDVSFRAVRVAVTGEDRLGTTVSFRAGIENSATQSAGLSPSSLFELTMTSCGPGAGLAAGTQAGGVIECSLCSEGTYSDVEALEPCIACGSADATTGMGATECVICPVGAEPEGFDFEGKLTNCTCQSGWWAPGAPNNRDCVACPRGGVCPGKLEPPYAAPGFFPSEDQGVFSSCPNTGACAGGSPFRCATGYDGELCGRCASGYYATSQQRCRKCDNRTAPIVILLIVGAMVLTVLLVWLNAKEEVTYRFAAVLIGFNSLQISALYAQIELEWPTFAREVFAAISFLVFDLSLTSPECAVESGNVWLLKWWLTILLPVFFGLAFGVLYVVVRFLAIPRGLVKMSTGLLMSATRRGYLQLLTLMYLPLTAAALSYFSCTRREDGKYALDASPDLVCYTTWYWSGLLFAIIAAAAYAVGIPAVIGYILWNGLGQNPSPEASALFALRYAFLVGRFRPEQYYFDILIMGRKVGCVLALVMFRSAALRANAALGVLAACLLHLAIIKPYRVHQHNVLAIVCLTSCAAVLWGVMFSSKPARIVTVCIALVINVLAILVGNVLDLIRIAREEKDINENELDSTDGFVVTDAVSLSNFDVEVKGDSTAEVQFATTDFMTGVRSPVTQMSPLSSVDMASDANCVSSV